MKSISKTLRDVITDHGCLDMAQLAILAVEYPALTIGVKFGCSMRTSARADLVGRIIIDRVTYSEDYVREIFIPCDTYDFIKGCIDRETLPGSPNWENSVESFLCRD